MRLTLVIIALFFLFSCNSEIKKNHFIGEAQGSTYSIIFYSYPDLIAAREIDSLLLAFDLSLSTYNPTSIISRINQNEYAEPDKWFINVFLKSIEVAEKTGGLFDPTVGPLVNAYGFGPKKKATIDTKLIDSLLKITGYDKVQMIEGKIIKTIPEIFLDFNAIAQGYSVDVVADFLEERGISNYLIEIGGEIRASGRKANDEAWIVGIDKPIEGNFERALNAVVELRDKSLATSGNYRKFYEENGIKYSHTINPLTGLPAKNNLLSATVIANDCMSADAYATAFMVMGYEKSLDFLEQNPELKLEVYFIYSGENGSFQTYLSESLSELISE
jgi:FAD:protein FMN transferase